MSNIESPPTYKPARYALFWWQNYFSDSPASVFKDEAYYDRNGRVIQPRQRQEYWTTPTARNSSWCFLNLYSSRIGGVTYPGDAAVCCDANCCSGTGCSGGAGDSGELCVIISVIALVCSAFIIAVALVFNYPPIMVVSWTVLVIGSFVEVAGTSVECLPIRYFNLASSLYILVVIVCVINAIIILQRLYSNYYPGTLFVTEELQTSKSISNN